jgi:stage II sporulation protein D
VGRPVTRGLLAVAVFGAACAAAAASKSAAPVPARTGAVSASLRSVRIALIEGKEDIGVTSSSAWEIFAADGQTPVALTQPGEEWRLVREGANVRARREDSRPVSAREQLVIIRPLVAGGLINVDGKRYRGELLVSAADNGVLVVNRLPMDDYLKGVVPREIGTSSQADVAAVEAQAVTARSYAYTHLSTGRSYDMRATVSDQVYGGVGAETRVGNLAVDETNGLVLLYGGQVVNAPYSSTCGGSTAEPEDVWRMSAEPYLKRVSDQIPGTDRFYCDEAPKFRWTRTFSREELRENMARYLRTLGRTGDVSSVQAVTVTDVTPAGRVATLTVDTDRGSVALHGNEIRNALRGTSGEILYSTYFSVEAFAGRNGIEQLTLRGGGNGHGVGMCQAGAIGRARRGQDFRTILSTYYPGTTVGTL